MTATKKPRRREWKPWLARIAFGASILALLGTSQPRWHIEATISGPNDGGAPPAMNNGKKALLVNVESSRSPELSYMNRYGARFDPAWGRGLGMAAKDEALKTSFLLPPNAALNTLTISGHCGGGCCSNEKCTPPQGSYVRATIDHVNVWTKSSRREQRVSVSSGPKKEGEKVPRIPHLVFEVEASKFVEGGVISNGDSDGKVRPLQLSGCYDPSTRAPSANNKSDAANGEGSSSSESDAGSEAPRQRCSHYAFNKPIKDPIDVSFVIEATIWGACPDPNTPCEAPALPPEPHIFDLRATTDY